MFTDFRKNENILIILLNVKVLLIRLKQLKTGFFKRSNTEKKIYKNPFYKHFIFEVKILTKFIVIHIKYVLFVRTRMNFYTQIIIKN